MRATSAKVQPRHSASVAASASPIASTTVLLAVGKVPSGHASAGTDVSIATAATAASGEDVFPVSAMTGMPAAESCSTTSRVSSVLPLLLIARTTSSLRTTPMGGIEQHGSPGFSQQDEGAEVDDQVLDASALVGL